MSWTTYKTFTVAGVTIVAEKGDGTTDMGYRITSPNTDGTEVPFNRMATVTDSVTSKIYAFAATEFIRAQNPAEESFPTVAFEITEGTLA